MPTTQASRVDVEGMRDLSAPIDTMAAARNIISGNEVGSLWGFALLGPSPHR